MRKNYLSQICPKQINSFIANTGKGGNYKSTWKLVPIKGEFSNIKNNPVKQFVRFEKPQNARYFKFVSKEAINGEDWVSVGEIGVLTK